MKHIEELKILAAELKGSSNANDRASYIAIVGILQGIENTRALSENVVYEV